MKIILNSNQFFPPLDVPNEYEDQMMDDDEQTEVEYFWERYKEKFGVDPPHEYNPRYDTALYQALMSHDWVTAFNRYIDEHWLPKCFKMRFVKSHQSHDQNPCTYLGGMSSCDVEVDISDDEMRNAIWHLSDKPEVIKLCNDWSSTFAYIRYTHSQFLRDCATFTPESLSTPLAQMILYHVLYESHTFDSTDEPLSAEEAVNAFNETYNDVRDDSRSNGVYYECFEYPFDIDIQTEPVLEEEEVAV